jgi:signal transduction histidine kinase
MDLSFNDIDTSKQLDSSIKTARNYINRIIGAVTVIKQLEKLEDNEIIEDLLFSSCRLLSQNMNMSYLYSQGLPDKTKQIVNAGELISSIVGECSRMLEGMNKRIQFTLDHGKCLVNIDEKSFTMAVMNLLQNALLYSPQNSTVIVQVSADSGFVCMSITNLTTLKRWSPPEEDYGLGIALCAKIAEFFGGKLEYIDSETTITAVLKLPFLSDLQDFPPQNNSSAMPLSSDFADYISESFKPVRLFMNEVLQKNK